MACHNSFAFIVIAQGGLLCAILSAPAAVHRGMQQENLSGGTAWPWAESEEGIANNYLITKDFDLTVAPMVELGIARILERVNLQMQRQALEEKRNESRT